MKAVGWLGNRQRCKLSIKAKNKQATSFYIKMQGILPKPEVYSEPSEKSKKVYMRRGSLRIVPVSGFLCNVHIFQMP